MEQKEACNLVRIGFNVGCAAKTLSNAISVLKEVSVNFKSGSLEKVIIELEYAFECLDDQW